MKSWILCATLLSGCAAFGQQPAFEVASIKPAAPMQMGKMMIRMTADAGMLRYTNVSLEDCIRNAYRVKDFQVQGPDWLGGARFDIVAKLPDGASQDQVPEMLQALLADRFKLVLHREAKEHAIYALVAAKGGPKLKPAEVSADVPPPGDGPAVSGGMVAGGPGGLPKGGPPRGNVMMRMDSAGAHLKAPSATIAMLADMLSRFSERPVVDMSGIEGRYDFDLVFSPETIHGMAGGPGPGPGRGPMMAPPPGGAPEHPPVDAPPAGSAGSIYDSVQHYGLKLEPRKAPMEILIVDSIEKTPTEN